jgi:hypothetical protein
VEDPVLLALAEGGAKGTDRDQALMIVVVVAVMLRMLGLAV